MTLPFVSPRYVPDRIRTIIHLAIIVLLPLGTKCLMGSEREPRNDGSLSLREFIGQIVSSETKDFYLNSEFLLHGKFLETSVRLEGQPLPKTKHELMLVLSRWQLVYHVDGDVVVIQDPALGALVDRNPLDVISPGISRNQKGLVDIVGAFGVSLSMGQVIGSRDIDRTAHLTIESTNPLSLRQALNQLTREYHVEWAAGILPADALPPDYLGPKIETRPDGTQVAHIYFPKGAIFMGIGGVKWQKAGTIEKEAKPTDEPPKPIATVDDLVTAILKTKGRSYTFYTEVAEDGAALAKAVAPPAGGIPVSLDGICQLLDNLSLGYLRHGNSILLLTPVPLGAGQVNPMEMKRSGVAITNGPIGLMSLFEINGRLEPPSTKLGDVLLKTPDMRVTSEGESSLRELLMTMAREKNCEWIAHVRPRNPPPAPGIKPAEPGLVRLTFSEKP